jgi:dethiobiotin synthetase
MLVVCTGTGTEVGKTWVGAAVLRTVQSRDRTVAARKPVQSFDPADPHPTDADVLAGATGEAPTCVCPAPRWLRTPLAPPMAAEALGLPPFTIADLVSELGWPHPAPDVRWVETAGGVRSPLAADGDTTDLCRAIDPDLVVIVADPGLGTINAVRLCAEVLRDWPVTVVLNRFDARDQLHARNRAWLADRDHLDVVIEGGEVAARLSRLG